MHCHICVETAGVQNKFVTDNNNTQAGARGGQHFFLGSHKITAKKKKKNPEISQSYRDTHMNCFAGG